MIIETLNVENICYQVQYLNKINLNNINHTFYSVLMPKKNKSYNIKDQCYYKRQDYTPSSYNSISPVTLHKYTFNTIAQFDVLWIDIYRHYFHHYYKKRHPQVESNFVKIIEEDISIFFVAFIEIFILKTLINPTSITILRMNLMAQIFGTCDDYRDISRLYKSKIERLLNDYQNKGIVKGNQKYDYLANIERIDKEIKRIVRKIQKDLQSQQYLQNLEHEQYLPKLANTMPQEEKYNFLRRYILGNIYSIRNIDVFRKSARREILSNFYNTNQGYFNVLNIPFIKKGNKEETISQIIVSSESNEKEPVLIRCKMFIDLFTFDQCKQKTKEILAVKNRLVQDIIRKCNQYTKLTNSIYPLLSIEDITFDQKKLKPFLRNSKLFLNQLGLTNKIKNAELKLALESTPLSFNFQEGPFQMPYQMTNIYLLKKKYYCKNYQRQNLLKEDNYDLPEKHYNQQAINELQEMISTWRIICIAYYIFHQRYFSKDLYEILYPSIYHKTLDQIDNNKPAPFYHKAYYEIMKVAHHKILKNQINLQEILGRGEKISLIQLTEDNYNQNQNEGQSKFNMKLLEKMYYLQQDDSLLENLKFQKIKSELYTRNLLTRQFVSLIQDKTIFKRLINPKRLLIIFYVYLIELMYQTALPIWLERRKVTTRKQLRIELSRQNRKISIIRSINRQKDAVKIIYNKFKQYSNRPKNDPNSIYVTKNQAYFKDIETIISNLDKICSFEEQIRLIQQNFLDKKRRDQPYQEMLKTIQDLCQYIMNTSKDVLNKFIEKDLIPNQNQYHLFHKLEDYKSQNQPNLTAKYLNKKLVVLLKVYMRLDQHNWKIFENYFRSYFISEKAQEIIRKIEKMEKRELYSQIDKLALLQKWFQHEQIKNYQQLRSHQLRTPSQILNLLIQGEKFNKQSKIVERNGNESQSQPYKFQNYLTTHS